MPIDILKIMSQSQPADCGAFEREIVVKKENVEAIKKALKSKGQIIVGTGGNINPNRKKIWFNPMGVNL